MIISGVKLKSGGVFSTISSRLIGCEDWIRLGKTELGITNLLIFKCFAHDGAKSGHIRKVLLHSPGRIPPGGILPAFARQKKETATRK